MKIINNPFQGCIRIHINTKEHGICEMYVYKDVDVFLRLISYIDYANNHNDSKIRLKAMSLHATNAPSSYAEAKEFIYTLNTSIVKFFMNHRIEIMKMYPNVEENEENVVEFCQI